MVGVGLYCDVFLLRSNFFPEEMYLLEGEQKENQLKVVSNELKVIGFQLNSFLLSKGFLLY